MDKSFFTRNTVTVAKDLLGKNLCRMYDGQLYKGMIVETEAYRQDEPACHAYCGLTPRNQVMFKTGGISYVYFIYGMHFCVNVVTELNGCGCAVLIRALEPVLNIDNTNGPAKLCNAMHITRGENGLDLTNEKSGLWIKENKIIEPENIVTTTRIGISQAVDYPWRFYIKDNPWVSKAK